MSGMNLNVHLRELGKSSVPQQSLPDGLRELYRNGLFSDVVLVCAGSRLKAHKVVLAARSSVFRQMFSQNPLVSTVAHDGSVPVTSPNEGSDADATPERVRVPETGSVAENVTEGKNLVADVGKKLVEEDVAVVHLDSVCQHPEAVQIMLDLIYEVGDDELQGFSFSSEAITQAILRLAHCYDLPDLSRHAVQWLAKGITTRNVVDRLALTMEFQLDQLNRLRQKIINHLICNKQDLLCVVNQPEVLQHPQLLQMLLQCATSLVYDEKEERVPAKSSGQPKATDSPLRVVKQVHLSNLPDCH